MSEVREQPTVMGFYWATLRSDETFRQIVKFCPPDVYATWRRKPYDASELKDYCGPLVDPLTEGRSAAKGAG